MKFWRHLAWIIPALMVATSVVSVAEKVFVPGDRATFMDVEKPDAALRQGSLDNADAAFRIDGGRPSVPEWVPKAGGRQATPFADFATEGGTNHYWYANAQYAGFAAFNTAIGATFSRASSATYLQAGVIKTALSNVPRFPTDINGNPTGLRLTGAGTNLTLQSQALSNAAWVNSGAVTGTGVLGPDGSSNIQSVGPTNAVIGHSVYQLYGTGVTGTFTLYAFAKVNTLNYLGLSFGNGATADGAFFNLSTGTIGTVVAGTSASIKALANGIYLCSVTRTVSSFNLYSQIEPHSADNQGYTWGGDGISNIYVGFVQLTASAFPLDYIPTTTATVTQAADSYTLPITISTDVTALFTWTDGVGTAAAHRLLDRQASGYIAADAYAGGNIAAYIVGGGSATQAFSPVVGTKYKFASAFGKASGNIRASRNAGTIFTGAGAAMGVDTALILGPTLFSDIGLFGLIPTFASDADLQRLSQ